MPDSVYDEWIPWVPAPKKTRAPIAKSYIGIPDSFTFIDRKTGVRHVTPGTMLVPKGDNITLIAIVTRPNMKHPWFDPSKRSRTPVFILQAPKEVTANPIMIHSWFDPPDLGGLIFKPWAIRVTQRPGHMVETQQTPRSPT